MVGRLVGYEVKLRLHDVGSVKVVEFVWLEVGEVGEALQENDAVVDGRLESAGYPVCYQDCNLEGIRYSELSFSPSSPHPSPSPSPPLSLPPLLAHHDGQNVRDLPRQFKHYDGGGDCVGCGSGQGRRPHYSIPPGGHGVPTNPVGEPQRHQLTNQTSKCSAWKGRGGGEKILLTQHPHEARKTTLTNDKNWEEEPTWDGERDGNSREDVLQRKTQWIVVGKERRKA